MIEVLQICCLMNYVWPKVQSYIGTGKLLDDILDQWKMGCLGKIAGAVKTMQTRGLKLGGGKVMWFENSASQTPFEKITSAFLGLEIWDAEMRYH